GPRYLMRVAELEMHPWDTADRRKIAQEEFGMGYCNITKCCTEVCPENIQITDNSLIPLKERVADRKYDPLVWLGRTIGRRPTDTPIVPNTRRPADAGAILGKEEDEEGRGARHDPPHTSPPEAKTCTWTAAVVLSVLQRPRFPRARRPPTGRGAR